MLIDYENYFVIHNDRPAIILLESPSINLLNLSIIFNIFHTYDGYEVIGLTETPAYPKDARLISLYPGTVKKILNSPVLFNLFASDIIMFFASFKNTVFPKYWDVYVCVTNNNATLCTPNKKSRTLFHPSAQELVQICLELLN